MEILLGCRPLAIVDSVGHAALTEFRTVFVLKERVCRGGRKSAAAMSLAADEHSATFHPVKNSFSRWIHNVDCERMVVPGNVSGTSALDRTFIMLFCE